MDLKLPPLGEGVDSGSVVSILVKEGDEITKGQGIIELETGKAVAPVPAPAAGKVAKIVVSVGDKISVGQVILALDGAGAAAAPAAKPAAAKAAPAPSAKPARAAAPPPEEEEAPEEEPEGEPTGPAPAAAPSLRRMARELGIDLRKIRGSEAGGRIVMADVRAYIQRLQKLAALKGGAAAAKPAPPSVDFSKWGPIAKRPMTPLRKVIAERMGQSWSAVPRVTQFEEADITALDALRKKYAPAFEKKGTRLTLTPFVLKVVADALKKYPAFNTSIDEAAGELIFKEYIHIGMAVDTEQGLIVPVLRDVDKKDLVTLSKELNDLAARTRDRKVSMEELQGGTFTISNQGGIGGGFFTPVINLPEVAILGVGRGALKPVVRDGKIEPRLLLPLALSYDHRAIDGGAAAHFALELKKGFETFDEKLCQV
ncbi:MAG TPA: 2-oxo acid dehydrogenase subunit E2 [Verrucomicrobiae bacterium]|jgi:pyruvate dehydrogenase E2 component (dihydrolipoamide acetyltransferase)|nr:2-oxo acid dehydrogenase subunit E2 [Verrucomicrobiae bacterium]